MLGRKWSLMAGCVIFLVGAVIQTANFGSLGQCGSPSADDSAMNDE